MTELLKNAAVSIASYAQAQTSRLIATDTPGNFRDPNPDTVTFTTEFTQSLNDSGRELAEAIAQVTGKR
jgi:hypothetical protein